MTPDQPVEALGAEGREKLTPAKRRVLSLCDGIGLYVDAFSGSEMRLVKALVADSLVFIEGGKRAVLTRLGRETLRHAE